MLSDGRRDRYFLCEGDTRWSLWIEGDPTGRMGPRRDMMAIHGPRDAVSEDEAAIFLLMDLWRSEDECFTHVSEEGRLSLPEVTMIACAVWPESRDYLVGYLRR